MQATCPHCGKTFEIDISDEIAEGAKDMAESHHEGMMDTYGD